MSPLYLAVSLNHSDITKYLLKTLKDSKMKRQVIKKIVSKINLGTNLTALSVALIIGNIEICNLLIEHGAQVLLTGSDV